MRNGIYLTLIVFLGTFAYTVVSRVGDTLEAGFAFLLASIAIGFLTTHFKRRVELIGIQKFINVIAISIFAIFGFIKGVALVVIGSIPSITAVVGLMFLVASVILAYSLSLFVKDKIYHMDDARLA